MVYRLGSPDYFAQAASLIHVFADRVAAHPNKKFLYARVKDANGRGKPGWKALTWAAVDHQIRRLAGHLRAQGLQAGERVMLVAENQPRWFIADMAIMLAGGVTVPAYVTNTVDDHRHILNDSGAVMAITDGPKLTVSVEKAALQENWPLVLITTTDDHPAQESGVHVLTWTDLMAEPAVTGDLEDMPALRRSDLACLIYTSGTGGRPKGVMHTHGMILHNIEGAVEILTDLGAERAPVFLSFLPLSHAYEHTAGQFLPMGMGAKLYYAEGLERLVANMGEVHPTVMTSVPRLFEAMRNRILRDIEKKGGLAQKMLDRAVTLGRRRYEQGGRLGFLDTIQDRLAEMLVRKKVRKFFGGRLKAFVSGGAPLNQEVGLFLHALGVPIFQGYGQTESAPVISVNRPKLVKMHTVGPPMRGVQVRIAADGEILVRGELVTPGYWNNEDYTAQTIDADGWLHTGDVGVLDEDGYLQITDRKKDIIVNAGGDNIAPQRVEGLLTLEPEIGQAMVYGDQKPYITALLVPDEVFLKEWAVDVGKADVPFADLVRDQDLLKIFRAAVDRVNGSLSSIERIRRFIMADEAFSIDNGLLTPSLKIRRHLIVQRYRERLEALYQKKS